jgi:hypothetical protein
MRNILIFLGRRNPIQLKKKKKVATILVLQRQRLPTNSDSDQALSIDDLDLQLWSVEEEELRTDEKGSSPPPSGQPSHRHKNSTR